MRAETELVAKAQHVRQAKIAFFLQLGWVAGDTGAQAPHAAHAGEAHSGALSPPL
jgi:hypothetical protein